MEARLFKALDSREIIRRLKEEPPVERSSAVVGPWCHQGMRHERNPREGDLSVANIMSTTQKTRVGKGPRGDPTASAKRVAP